jgi:hypothetical protein
MDIFKLFIVFRNGSPLMLEANSAEPLIEEARRLFRAKQVNWAQVCNDTAHTILYQRPKRR